MGKTEKEKLNPATIEKHPHERGEDTGEDGMATEEAGNTPTSVGKTKREAPADCSLRKHPHERGEDYLKQGNKCR